MHAKVGIVDDRWLTVGSANLNAHSLLNDTEMNVVTDDAGLARDTRVRLWAEHLELDPDTVAAGDPSALVDEHWRPIAAEQLERRERDAAADASLHRAPRRLQARAPPPGARCRGSPTTADARFARSLRPFCGTPAVVPSAPSVRSRAAFGRELRRVPVALTTGNGVPTGPSGPGANRRLKAGVAHVS